MNKFKGRTVTLSKLIIIKQICALFIYLLQLVGVHSVHCVHQITRTLQTTFRKCLHSMNSGTTKDRELFSSCQIPVFYKIYSVSMKSPAVRTPQLLLSIKLASQ